MKYIKSLLFFLGLALAGQFSVAAPGDQLLAKCRDNLAFIKSIVDKGVIKDSTYLKTIDLLKSSKTDPLSQKRRALNVNKEALENRMAFVANYLKKNEANPCMFNSADLIRNLSDYADFAQGMTGVESKGKGLDKFIKNWQAKVYILDEAATSSQPPSDLPPELPPLPSKKG